MQALETMFEVRQRQLIAFAPASVVLICSWEGEAAGAPLMFTRAEVLDPWPPLLFRWKQPAYESYWAKVSSLGVSKCLAYRARKRVLTAALLLNGCHRPVRPRHLKTLFRMTLLLSDASLAHTAILSGSASLYSLACHGSQLQLEAPGDDGPVVVHASQRSRS